MAKRVTPLFAVVALGLGGGTAAAEQAPTTPRTLPSGAPACGNAQTKSPVPCTTTSVAKVEPRVLRNGAPACGNMNRKDSDTADPTYLACIRDEAIVVRNKLVVGKLLQLFGLSTSLTIAPARPRELRTGAPAPGNVARRTPAREEPREEPREQPRGETHND